LIGLGVGDGLGVALGLADGVGAAVLAGAEGEGLGAHR
jgi:hypothetical protein